MDLLRDRYDDGGFSGGTMERPALQRLLADIATSRIDVVVVYKVDRLTRALSDFARIVEGYAIARKQLLRQFQCQFFSKTARAPAS
jgi:site-specific DNA recombinase